MEAPWNSCGQAWPNWTLISDLILGSILGVILEVLLEAISDLHFGAPEGRKVIKWRPERAPERGSLLGPAQGCLTSEKRDTVGKNHVSEGCGRDPQKGPVLGTSLGRALLDTRKNA